MSITCKISLVLMAMLGSLLTLIFQNISHRGITTISIKSMNRSMVFLYSVSTELTTTLTTPIPVSKLPKPKQRKTFGIFKWNSTRWSWCSNCCFDAAQFISTPLQTPSGSLTIFIHDVNLDKYVSGDIKKYGVWEPHVMGLIHHFMSVDPSMNLIDIGSHIGQYSLMAAKMGRKAIAVDPLMENVQRLCKSIQHNNFESFIRVFYVALSDSRRKVTFGRSGGNIGGTQIVSIAPTVSRLNATGETKSNSIDTVLLDDLLPFVPFKKAFMKIDVESHESSVFKGGDMFFKTVDVPYIIMEWMFHKTNPTSASDIIHFMMSHRYVPFHVDLNPHPLLFKDSVAWPTDVLWIKIY